MKLAIHNSQNGFHPRWIKYCDEKNIPYKVVNCYDNNIIEQLKDCQALLWHFHHTSIKDFHVARSILFALEHTGFTVFPDFKTAWHFDNKVAQKYLLERLSFPLVPSYVFVNRADALNWASTTVYPKVFKLKGGAGSNNVKLVKSLSQAKQVIGKAFGSGFSNYNGWSNLNERIRKWKMGKVPFFEVFKGAIRLFKPPDFAKGLGVEYGYVYFQDFIPQNDSDIRIIVIDKKAFAIKRFVRKNDFRASGSGLFSYEKELFNESCLSLAFECSRKFQLQCCAYDFIFDNGSPMLVEMSYGFSVEAYDFCPGFWDEQLKWHEEKFNPQGWMIDSIINHSLENKILNH